MLLLFFSKCRMVGCMAGREDSYATRCQENHTAPRQVHAWLAAGFVDMLLVHPAGFLMQQEVALGYEGGGAIAPRRALVNCTGIPNGGGR